MAMHRTRPHLLPLMSLLLTSSCTGDTMWHQHVQVDPYGWHSNDTVCIDLPPAPISGTYAMDIELRTTTSFPYRSLCVVRQLLLSHPDTVLCDTLSIPTSTDGRNLTGNGITVQNFVQPAPDIHLLQGQQASVRLRHIMARGTMPDILDIGIRVTPRQ